MNYRILFVTIATAVLSLAFSSAEAREDERIVRCESSGSKPTYCQTNTRGYVEMRKQLSRTECREGDTWGADGDGGGVWVREGCRADFAVQERGGWGRWRGDRRGHDRRDDRRDDRRASGRIRCASKDWGYNHCEVDGRIRNARVAKQISGTRCQQGDNWDVDRSGIWVDRGCEAEFQY